MDLFDIANDLILFLDHYIPWFCAFGLYLEDPVVETQVAIIPGKIVLCNSANDFILFVGHCDIHFMVQ